MRKKNPQPNTPGYEQDFYVWTLEQARLLRAGELSQIDVANVAEEIESLGRRDRRELIDRLEKLLVELLKWQIDPGARCGHWKAEIFQQRFETEQVVDDSPSLREYAAQQLNAAYTDARDRLIGELGLLQPNFPTDCPFTLDQVLSRSFLPES